jgi:hypothetical protein
MHTATSCLQQMQSRSQSMPVRGLCSGSEQAYSGNEIVANVALCMQSVPKG